MSESSGKAGGITFGNVGGDAKLTAGGDIVGGNKTTNTQRGFASQESRQQFQAQLDELRETLRAFKTQVESHPALAIDQKEELANDILTNVAALKELKAKTSGLAPAAPRCPGA